jgi:ribonuclease R
MSDADFLAGRLKFGDTPGAGAVINQGAITTPRGGTVYLPGYTARMLPPTLSEGVVSLLPHVDRRAVIFVLDVAATGACLACTVERAVVRSVCKTNYAAVQAWFDAGTPADGFAPGVAASLRALAGFGRARITRAECTGVVRVRRTEVAVDVAGGSFVALREVRTEVDRWSEQLSLLANAEGAALLARYGGVPGVEPIYRVVAPPDARALAGLRRTADDLIALHGLPVALQWGADEPLADWLTRLPETPVGAALHRAAMLVGGGAVYQSAPGPHAGVGAEVYARFTAPMREIVGVFLHAELLAAVAGAPRVDAALQADVIAAGSRHRRLQREADRAVNEHVLDQLFGADLAAGTERTAVVMGLQRDRVHVTLDDPPIDAKVYLAHTPALRADGLVVREGPDVRYRVGDRVHVRVTGRTADRWTLALRR